LSRSVTRGCQRHASANPSLRRIGPHRHDRLSPISFASKVRTPVLIVHAEDDTKVPVSQATFFHRALRRFGVEHEFVVYLREGHPIQERNHQLDLLRRTRAWFDRWLGAPTTVQDPAVADPA
jgi:dipeptidyl aminopeptidase/acylaminoacyl peptidase